MWNPLDWFAAKKKKEVITPWEAVILGNGGLANISLGKSSGSLAGIIQSSSAYIPASIIRGTTYIPLDAGGFGSGYGAHLGIGIGYADGHSNGDGGDQPEFDYRTGIHKNWSPGQGFGDAQYISYGH